MLLNFFSTYFFAVNLWFSVEYHLNTLTKRVFNELLEQPQIHAKNIARKFLPMIKNSFLT